MTKYHKKNKPKFFGKLFGNPRKGNKKGTEVMMSRRCVQSLNVIVQQEGSENRKNYLKKKKT